MKKTSLYLASIFICGTALAGNAPENTESKSFSFGGNVIMDGFYTGSVCYENASPMDVFAEELNETNASSITSDLETLGFATGSTLGYENSMTFDLDTRYSQCDTATGREKIFNFEFTELSFETSGELSNGLHISLKDTFDIQKEQHTPEALLESEYGSLLFKQRTSAVDNMLVGTAGSGAKTAITPILDGHITNTSGGDDGLNAVYFTPSFSGLDVALGLNINDSNLGSASSEFETYSVGFGYETYVGDMVISLGGGIEKATNDIDTAASCLTDDLATAESATSSDSLYDGLYGSKRCGSETLSAIGAELGYGNYTISTAFSSLDSSNSDSSTWSVGIGRSFNDVDYTIGYTEESLDYARKKVSGESVEDSSKIIMLEASRPLNERIDLGLNFSTTEIDKASQQLGNGAEEAWRAGVSVAIDF